MSKAIDEIIEWAKDKLAYWEQILFDKLLKQAPLTDDDYLECLNYMLQDEDISPISDNRPIPSFSGFVSKEETPKQKVFLKSISNLRNINALVHNQKLNFDKNLTVVYGKNGSGKSGYARVLGRAGFTRGNTQLLHDIMSESTKTNDAYACLELSVDDITQSLDFTGHDLPLMRAFYMLDSVAIDAHLNNQNELSFSPTGLAILKELVNATDEVRKRLTEKIERLKTIPSPKLDWQEESIISQKFVSLVENIDLTDLENFSQFSPEKSAQMKALEEDLSRLSSQDIVNLINKLEQEKKDILSLKIRLEEISQQVANDAIDAINKIIEEYNSTDRIIEQHNLYDFTHPKLQSIGTQEWQQFVKSAKRFADMQGDTYPQAGDVCILCHQALENEAQEHLQRLWKFLTLGSQVQLKNLEESLILRKNDLSLFDFDFFEPDTVQYRYLQSQHADFHSELIAYHKYLIDYRQIILDAIDQHTIISNTHNQNSNYFSEHIDGIVAGIEKQILELGNKETNAESLKALQKEYIELKHHRYLSQNFDAIKAHIDRVQWIAKAEKIGGNSRKITQKHNELFEKYVTHRYIETFDNILKKLGRPLRVEIATKAQKGQTLKQIVLKANSNFSKVKTELVLSEGEKRAVAFADFMTEVELDTNCAGIILDDPVTSLDLEWRATIAELLVEQAHKCQVIVFTHDIPFLHLIKTTTSRAKLPCQIHQIAKGITDEKPGYIYLNNAPILEQDYKTSQKAEDAYKKAKNEPNPSNHSDLLQNGMDALRTSYEALVVFTLLNGVVQRYDDCLSVGNLRKIVWDTNIVEEICSTYEFLSRYIKGHLHVDNPSHKPLTLQLLREQIDKFNALKKKINKA